MNTEPLIGIFHDATTGETYSRELTQEEINSLIILQEEEVTDGSE